MPVIYLPTITLRKLGFPNVIATLGQTTFSIPHQKQYLQLQLLINSFMLNAMYKTAVTNDHNQRAVKVKV